MADYTKLKRAIWRDTDFKELPSLAKLLYIMLISLPEISSCGVLSRSIRRWTTLLHDTDADSVSAAFDVLVEREYVWFDESTDEVAIRTYMVHDELWKQRQGGRSLEIAMSEVLSSDLKSRLLRVNLTPAATLALTLESTLERLQQQQTSASPSAAAAAPSDPPSDEGPADGLGDVVAAAYELLIRNKIRTENVHNATGFTKKLRRDLPIEHAAAMAKYLADHPDAAATQLATEVLGLTTLDLFNLRGAA